MVGIFLRHEGALVPLVEAPYKNEALLQQLVAQHPETLAGDRDTGPLLLIRREAAVYDEAEANTHGSLDHLFLDSEGIAVLVEVKRSTDSRSGAKSWGRCSTTLPARRTGRSRSSGPGWQNVAPPTRSTSTS